MKKKIYEKPRLRLMSTVVPLSFLKKFPVWDRDKASKNLKIIAA